MTTSTPEGSSPNWSASTKLVLGLTIAALAAGLLIYFRSIIGPLLLAGILTYLLHPLAYHLSDATRLSWRSAANLIYLLLVIILAGLSTLTGLAVVQQSQSLIRVIQNFVIDLPELIEQISANIITIGPFQIDLSQFLDLNTIGEQLINSLQLIISRAGTLVSTFASGAASTLGWGFFVLLVSYFLLADAGKVPDSVNYINIPGYDSDIRRMGRELGRIWNAFLRGQLIIVVLVIISYTILLTALGVRYSLALALLAGLARFVPYVGPLTSGMVTALVTFFQGQNYFGLEPIYYMLLVLVTGIILDQIYDNLISPRILGQTLGVHPAGVLVVAIIAANLIGIVGLLLAAPVLATVQLVGRYTIRKMFDLDPWPEPETQPKPMEFPWLERAVRRLRAWWRARSRLKR